MCINCESDGIGRRDLMKFGAAAAIALAAGSAAPAARAAEGAPTALSPQEALAELKAGNERFVSHPELCSVDLAAEPQRRRRASGAVGDDRRLRRQPRAARAYFRRSRRRRTVRLPRRRQSHRCRHARDHRIWRSRPRLSARRDLRAYRLRRGESRLRHRYQERNLSRRHRTHDRADRAGGACRAQCSRRLR